MSLCEVQSQSQQVFLIHCDLPLVIAPVNSLNDILAPVVTTRNEKNVLAYTHERKTSMVDEVLPRVPFRLRAAQPLMSMHQGHPISHPPFWIVWRTFLHNSANQLVFYLDLRAVELSVKRNQSMSHKYPLTIGAS